MATLVLPDMRCDEAGFYHCGGWHEGRHNIRFFVPGQLIPQCPDCQKTRSRFRTWRNVWYLMRPLNWLQAIVDARPWLDPAIRWPHARRVAAGHAAGEAGVLICPGCRQLHGTEGSQPLYQCGCGGTVWLFIWPESQFDPAMNLLV